MWSQELIATIHGITEQYDREFQIAALRGADNERMVPSNLSTSLTPGGWINVFIDAPQDEEVRGIRTGNGHGSQGSSALLSNGEGYVSAFYGSSGDSSGTDGTPPKGGAGSLPSSSPVARFHDTLSSRSVYAQIWRGIQVLALDPCPSVAQRSESIIQTVLGKVSIKSLSQGVCIHVSNMCCIWL